MYQRHIEATAARPYDKAAFSDRFRRLFSRHEQSAENHIASRDEAIAALAEARASIGSPVSREVLLAALDFNPEILRVVDTSSDAQRPMFLAYLPLTGEGIEALIDGRLDTQRPDHRFLCRAKTPPAALYIWLVHAPGTLGQVLQGLAPVFDELAPAGCPLYIRPASVMARKLFAKAGFAPVPCRSDHGPVDLMVLPVEGEGCSEGPCHAPAAGDALTVGVARTIEDLVKTFAVRAATYIAEQHCPYGEEYDGNDFCATHLLGEIDGEPAGCIRVRFFADFVKIERLAVRAEFRGSTLATLLVREAICYARRKGYRRAYGHSRVDLVDFWGRFGFTPLPGRSSFVFSDVEYVELESDLADCEGSIAIGADPYVIIRPEGEWDLPGPLDRSADRHNGRAIV